ncbi:MAG: tRNA (adenosine(37)-N6)-dimethylallyltransferase MiaA [Clostridia bacterium]|nr:tRNA (adenosine(37)-N6)-dimethylallyltransferase MiaA [Clostridia bacterium]
MNNLFLPIIAGPTASGKTSLAIALAKRFEGEIVSADSMQIYEGLHIGTARPLADEQEGIPHHLMGFAPLSHAFSVAEYCNLAHKTISDIAARGHLPILCGGTGLYIQAVADNLQFAEEPLREDRTLREQLQKRALEEGGTVLLTELSMVDPETAARLHENDIGRIIRALELYHLTGRTMTEHNRLSRSVPSPYCPFMIVLDVHDRALLYNRIDQRVDIMLKNGLLEEAKQVLRSPYAPTAMQAIGYKELAPYFAGDCSLDTAIDNLKRGTRRYAKRQLSWFRNIADGHHLYLDDYPNTDTLIAAAETMLLIKMKERNTE